MLSLFSSLKAVYSFLREAWFLGTPHWSPEAIPDLTGQVFIVTGGNSGLGKDTVRALLEHDARVYVASRDEKRSLEAIDELFEQTGRRALFLQLDLADLESVKNSATEFLRRETRLDALFNNAALLSISMECLANGYDPTFHTNVLGPFYFTKLLIPLLASTSKTRDDGHSRIVNISSSVNHLVETLDFDTFKDGPARRKQALDFFYCQSKFATILLSNEFSRRYSDQGIVSIAVNPGNFMTRLQRHDNWLRMTLLNFSLFLYPPEWGCVTQLWAGVTPEALDANGKYVIPWGRVGQPNAETGNVELAVKLWVWLQDQVEDV